MTYRDLQKLRTSNKWFVDNKEPVLCARTFEDGRFGRCIMFENKEYKSIISFDTFDHNGGLTKLDVYGAGLDSYLYRRLTFKEIESLKLEYLDTIYDGRIQSIYNSCKIDVKSIINNEYKKIRKQKLEKISLSNG